MPLPVRPVSESLTPTVRNQRRPEGRTPTTCRQLKTLSGVGSSSTTQDRYKNRGEKTTLLCPLSLRFYTMSYGFTNSRDPHIIPGVSTVGSYGDTGPRNRLVRPLFDLALLHK